MKNCCLRFACPRCKARIKAPLQLVGEQRKCPGCGHAFIVKRYAPDDAEPRLVPLEPVNHFVLGVA